MSDEVMITEESCRKRVLLEKLAMALDTDGNIRIENARPGTHTQRIGFGNTNIKIIKWLVENFGGRMPKEQVFDNPKHKSLYNWTLSGSNSYNMLKKIRPFLIIKQEQADLAIELYEKVSKWKYHSDKPMPKYKQELAEELYQKCRALNKKGKHIKDVEVEVLVPVKVRKDVLDEWLE